MTDWVPRPPNLSDKLVDWEAFADAGGEQGLIVGRDVVDVGAEWGADMLIFADKARSYVACDRSPLCLDHLKAIRDRLRSERASVAWCDLVERWPFADASADTVLDFSSLDDSSDPRAGYCEALRVLRPGGVLVTSYANEDVVGVGSNYTASRPCELRDWMRRAGYRVLRRRHEDRARAVLVCQKREEVDMVTMEQTRQAWTRAQKFPLTKEQYYPGHAEAHGFDAEAGKVVLEYGCGGGSDTMSLLRRGCEVYYADVVHSNVDTTLKHLREAGLGFPDDERHGLRLDASDRIPLPDGCLDVVTSHGVVHHIEEPVPVLREFRRLLKPGGRLYVMLYTENLRARADPEVTRLHKERGLEVEEAFCWYTDGPGTPWADWYNVDEGEDLLERAGFKNAGHRDYNFCAENFGKPDFRTFKGIKP